MSKPPGDTRTNEQYYFDTLKRIASYDSPEELQRLAEKRYGLDGSEAIEYAYENVLTEARQAIKGMRRPRDGSATQRPTLRDEPGTLEVTNAATKSEGTR